VPQACGYPEIGSVVATGDSMASAIKEVSRIAEKVQGFYVEVHPEAMDAASGEFAKLKEAGIKV
jgi:hypothetical protein